MDPLPFDMNSPAVRDHLTLNRLQVLTPLSLLINIATVLVCAIIVRPSLGGVSRLHITAMSPNTPVIAVYISAFFLMQVGYCVLLVLAKKQETKKLFIQAVGFPLVFSNFVMVFWAIAWVMQWFLVSTVAQGILLLLLLYSNIALLVYHPPVSSRPFDTAFIHAPVRFFFVLVFSLLFPLCLFITLGFSHTPSVPDTNYSYKAWQVWPVFGVVLGTNLIGFLVVVLRRDIVWAVAATWICISIWSSRPKPAPIYATVIGCTVLHPLGLVMAEIYHWFYQRRQAVLLVGDDERLYRPRSEQEGRRQEGESAPREINDDNLWQ